MDKDFEKVEPLSIKKIEPIIFINLKSYEIDSISKSVKDIGYEPLIVRPKDKVPRKKSGYHVRWKNEMDKRSLNDLKK